MCKYTDTGEEVFCLFPFTGENPGQKRGGTSHDTCLKTKKGHTWCAVRLSLSNRLLGTSVQNRDVDCGPAKNSKGSLLCPGNSTNIRATTRRPTTTPRAPPRSSTARTTIRPSSARPWASVVGTTKSGSPTTRSPTRPSAVQKPSGQVSDSQLAVFSEQLLKADENNVANLVDLKVGYHHYQNDCMHHNFHLCNVLVKDRVHHKGGEERRLLPKASHHPQVFTMSQLMFSLLD